MAWIAWTALTSITLYRAGSCAMRMALPRALPTPSSTLTRSSAPRSSLQRKALDVKSSMSRWELFFKITWYEDRVGVAVADCGGLKEPVVIEDADGRVSRQLRWRGAPTACPLSRHR